MSLSGASREARELGGEGDKCNVVRLTVLQNGPESGAVARKAYLRQY